MRDKTDAERLAHIKPFTLKSVDKRQGLVVSYRWDSCGWAVLQMDDVSGVVSIESDYGNWNYCWPKRGHPGESLYEFFISAGDDYLAEKLWGGNRYEYDVEASLKSIKEEILRARREDSITKGLARTLYDESKYLDDSVGAEAFVRDFSSELWDFLGCGADEFMVRNTKFDYLVLRDRLLPFLKEHLNRVVNMKLIGGKS